MRVLFLPELVGGEPVGLSKALRVNGFETQVVARQAHPFGYPADVVIHRGKATSRWRRAFRIVLALKYLFGSWDVVHFNSGSTLLDPGYSKPAIAGPAGMGLWLVRRIAEGGQWLELLTLKLRGVKIYVHFQGSDARQDTPWAPRVDDPEGCEVGFRRSQQVSQHRFKQRRIRRWSLFADKIYFLNPDLAKYLPARAEFIPYASVDPKAVHPPPYKQRKSELIVAHAPSNRVIKGTSLIELAVEHLRAQAFPIRLDIIESVSNAEVLRRLSLAHVVVDQLHIGWYGALAVEAMALGKPVICYIKDDDLRVIDPAMKKDLPVMATSPESIGDTLLKVLEMDSKEIEALGKRSRDFSLKWHDPGKIAARLYSA